MNGPQEAIVRGVPSFAGFQLELADLKREDFDPRL